MLQSSRHLGQSADSMAPPPQAKAEWGKEGTATISHVQGEVVTDYYNSTALCDKTLYTESFSLQEQHKTKHQLMIQMIIYI